jgi:hypothetical protein
MNSLLSNPLFGKLASSMSPSSLARLPSLISEIQSLTGEATVRGVRVVVTPMGKMEKLVLPKELDAPPAGNPKFQTRISSKDLADTIQKAHNEALDAAQAKMKLLVDKASEKKE